MDKLTVRIPLRDFEKVLLKDFDKTFSPVDHIDELICDDNITKEVFSRWTWTNRVLDHMRASRLDPRANEEVFWRTCWKLTLQLPHTRLASLREKNPDLPRKNFLFNGDIEATWPQEDHAYWVVITHIYLAVRYSLSSFTDPGTLKREFNSRRLEPVVSQYWSPDPSSSLRSESGEEVFRMTAGPDQSMENGSLKPWSKRWPKRTNLTTSPDDSLQEPPEREIIEHGDEIASLSDDSIDLASCPEYEDMEPYWDLNNFGPQPRAPVSNLAEEDWEKDEFEIWALIRQAAMIERGGRRPEEIWPALAECFFSDPVYFANEETASREVSLSPHQILTLRTPRYPPVLH